MRVSVAIVMWCLLLVAGPAQAGTRIALLIGNEKYNSNIGTLSNPENDVMLVEKALKDVGFQVERPVINATAETIRARVFDFVDKLKAAGPDATGFFYYVGHGMASDDNAANYLVPVELERLDKRTLVSKAVKLSEITDQFKAATRAGAIMFVVFDACRSLAGTKGSGRGFVPIETLGGMHIAFATQAGDTASDGEEGSTNGPFALALANNIRLPGNYLTVYSRIKEQVIQITHEEQRPLYFEDIGSSKFTFLEDKKIAAEWEKVKDGTEPLQLLEFRRTYRGSEFDERAEELFNEMGEKAKQAALAHIQQHGVARSRNIPLTQMIVQPAPFEADSRNRGVLTRSGKTSVIVWQVAGAKTIVWVDPKNFEILQMTEMGQAPPPVAGVAGAVFLEVREAKNYEKINDAKLVIDVRNGLYEPNLSRESESVFLFVQSAIDFMRVRLGHGEYLKEQNELFSSLKVYVVEEGLNTAYFCASRQFGCPEDNSFVVGRKFATGVDIVGHELSHHFLLRTANMLYEGEAGSVQESFADLFGTLLELYFKGEEGNWELGDSLPGFSASSPIRSMSNPLLPDSAGNIRFNKTARYSKENSGNPDHDSLRVRPGDEICDSAGGGDSGCIHMNIGILNKAFYLMGKGGEHYGIKVRGIGERKLERIAYTTVMFNLKSADGFYEAGAALRKSCQELSDASLFGIGSADCAEVAKALEAVGLGEYYESSLLMKIKPAGP